MLISSMLAGLTLIKHLLNHNLCTLCIMKRSYEKGTRVKVSIWRRSVKGLLSLYAKPPKSEECAHNAFHYVFISIRDKLGMRTPDPPRPAPTQPSFSVVFIQNQNTGKNKRDLVKIRTRITRNRRVSSLAYVIYVISLLVQYVQGIKLNAESLSWQIRQEIISFGREL